jgi:hypothetical protein
MWQCPRGTHGCKADDVEAPFTRGRLVRSTRLMPFRGVSVHRYYTVLGIHLAAP